MGKVALWMICAGIATTLIPMANANSLLRGREGTYLDFRTNQVYDADGNNVGAASPDMYSGLNVWTWGEPMRTTALRVDATVQTEPTPGADVETSDAGLCLHAYCVAGDAMAWGDTLLQVTWYDCNPTLTLCVERFSPDVYGSGLISWAGAFDPPTRSGVVLHACLWINYVPVMGNCLVDRWWTRPEGAPYLPSSIGTHSIGAWS